MKNYFIFSLKSLVGIPVAAFILTYAYFFTTEALPYSVQGCAFISEARCPARMKLISSIERSKACQSLEPGSAAKEICVNDAFAGANVPLAGR